MKNMCKKGFVILSLLSIISLSADFTPPQGACPAPAGYKEPREESTLLNTYEDGYKLYLNLSRDKTIYNAIANGLDAYNAEKTGQTSYNHCTISITSTTGEVIAGVTSDIYRSRILGDICLVHSLWVDEGHRRHGLGTLIMRKLIAYVHSKNCSLIQLEELTEYQDEVKDQAKAFLETLGFVTVTTIPSPNITSGRPIYIMRKTIDQEELYYDFSQQYAYMMQNNFTCKLEEDWNNKVSLTILDNLEFYYSSRDVYTYFISCTGRLSTLFITSDSGEIIAGTVFRIFSTNESSYCVINKLWVNDKYRKHNFGRKLMHALEQYAKSEQCLCIQLDTWQWQAKGFYEKLGYTIIATVPNPKNCTGGEQYYMRKML